VFPVFNIPGSSLYHALPNSSRRTNSVIFATQTCLCCLHAAVNGVAETPEDSSNLAVEEILSDLVDLVVAQTDGEDEREAEVDKSGLNLIRATRCYGSAYGNTETK